MYDFKTIEETARKILEKHKKEAEAAIQDAPKKPIFSFLEGPPTANAPPGLHHLEVRTFKDIICKFKFMQGFSVPRKGGWDTHGLPVEVQVEKSLGLKSKKEVLKYGMDKFIKQCRESVFSNISDWEKSTEELGYWIDLKNPYVTLDNNYIESVWWSLKELYNKKLLYEGFKVVPFCTRCGTPLSSHEVALGYKDVNEDSVYVAFKLKNGEYILAWTTTPWTLPGNVALAVGKDIDYVKVKLPDGDKLILGEDRLNVLNLDYKIIEKIKGKDLIGLKYEPLYDIKELQNENSHKVILADFVTTEDGTGIVHTAGMYGEDDYEICKKNKLPLVHTVGEDGKFLDIAPEFIKGKFVKSVEKEIIEDLKKRHLLFKKEKISHSYPFCWRCDSPLLYYAINSWFIKVTAVKDKLIKLNEKINWYPNHIKDGRFGKWLENIKDWSLSRFKFWGTPLPIWRCSDEKCGREKIIGSVEELKQNSVKKFQDYDLHRPWIDKIKLKCKCGKEMERISDLIDVWYDSGAAPFAQFHYPFENKKYFEKRFPYDYIAEAIDQTRGWFYTLHAISTMLFEDVAYKNVICAGHVVDEKGEKMSKSKGNVIAPKEIIDKAGIDAIRLQFCTTDAGNQKRFSFDLMKESVIPFLTILYNCNNYYKQLEDSGIKFPASSSKKGKQNKNSSINIEDKWILSRLNSVIEKATNELNNYSLSDSLKEIIEFVVKDFSRGYIKMTREREDTKEIIGEVLEKISLILAPFAPYLSEDIYSNFSKDSVHLSKWPKADKNKIDEKLEEEFDAVNKIIEVGLAERDEVQIGLKWPLKELIIDISGKDAIKTWNKFKGIISNQLNIQNISILQGAKETDYPGYLKIPLPNGFGLINTKLTPELEAEGYTREISRKIQAFRKELGLEKNKEINLQLIVDENLKKILEKNKGFIKERTNAKELCIITDKENKERFKKNIKFKIKEKEGVIGIFIGA